LSLFAFVSFASSQKVKPGDAIIFFQNIKHEIRAHKVDKTSLRQYLGWRLTAEDSPLNGDEETAMANQAVPHLPSGQMPQVFEKMHRACHFAKLKVSFNFSTLISSSFFFSLSLSLSLSLPLALAPSLLLHCIARRSGR
jgi:hypothetical protein